ncbi:MAG: hypothetical protein ABI345_14710 [Jatrophihabitans sp.]
MSDEGREQRRRRASRDGGADRGLRDLAGTGSSQVGVSGALRARDVNRPSADDLAEAERHLVLVRRNWQPENSGKPATPAQRAHR